MCTQTPSGNPHTPVNDTTRLPQADSHTSTGKVEFLAYRVSPEASLVLERVHGLHKDTFAKFSMASRIIQTGVLKSFASFIESMSTTKINETNEEALQLAEDSVKDFEHFGLDLSWLKNKLYEAKTVNKILLSRSKIDYYESQIQLNRTKLRHFEAMLAKAKEEEELLSWDLPRSLGEDDSQLKGVF